MIQTESARIFQNNCKSDGRLNDEKGDSGRNLKSKYTKIRNSNLLQTISSPPNRIKRNEFEPLRCSFKSSVKHLICNGFNGKSVDCEASKVELNGSLPSFKLFAISSKPIGESFQVKFSLYPQNSRNPYFLDTELTDKLLKRSISYSIYFSGQYPDNGLRILKPICWKHLIDLFSEMSVFSSSFSIKKETGHLVQVDTSVGILTID